MTTLRIRAEWVVLPGGCLVEGPYFVTVLGDTITDIHTDLGAVQRCEQQEWMTTHLLTPGFIDIHTHGVGGSEDVIDFWLHPEYTQHAFPSQGTTSFLASVIFPKEHPERTHAVLARLARSVGSTAGGGAVLEGIHAEGPVVHDLGAMPPVASNISLADFEELLDSIPSLKMMTISPHLEAARGYERIKALVKRGVMPALGHDRVATEAEILGALACSTQKMHITHLFNVCSFHHRSPSLVNFGLCQELPNQPAYAGIPSPTIELIGDLAHVHPMVVATALKARDFNDVIFVSDSVLEPKPGATVRYLSRKVRVSDDCRSLSLVGENVLAGSCCTLLDTFHSLVRILKIHVGQAIYMLTENPAKIAGLRHIGKLMVGMRADLLFFDKDMNLMQTMVAGQIYANRSQK